MLMWRWNKFASRNILQDNLSHQITKKYIPREHKNQRKVDVACNERRERDHNTDSTKYYLSFGIPSGEWNDGFSPPPATHTMVTRNLGCFIYLTDYKQQEFTQVKKVDSEILNNQSQQLFGKRWVTLNW